MSFSNQLLWVELGLIAALLVATTLQRPRRLAEFKYLAGSLGVFLLLAPIFFGTVRGGSKLWLVFGGYSFQPAEPAKILLAIFLAAYLAEKKEVLAWPKVRHFGPLIVTWLLSLAILILERDLGSSLIFFSLFLVMLYIATGRAAYVGVGLALFLAGTTMAYRLFSHVAARIDVWLAPLPSDISGSVYQVAQSLFALEAGGMTGVGLGAGLLGRAISMPAVHTDFIFSVWAEEAGLLGAAALLVAFLLLFARGFHAAIDANDDFLMLLAAGLATVTAIQAIIIIGGVIKALPLTGVTLPLVSYGGSSVISSFIMLGLILSISRQT
jgi:cell division protein FtsW (lipid II flippase)